MSHVDIEEIDKYSESRDSKHVVKEIYEINFTSPFPARNTFQVAALPAAGKIEMEAVINIKTMSERTSKEDQ